MQPIETNPYLDSLFWYDLRIHPDALPKDDSCVLNQDGDTVYYENGKWHYAISRYDPEYATKPVVLLWCRLPKFDVKEK